MCNVWGTPYHIPILGFKMGMYFVNLIKNEENSYILELKNKFQRSNTMSKCNK